MTKDLHAKLPDGTMAALQHIAEVSGKTKTDVLIGMVDHWAAVMEDHKRRGFQVVPTPEASFSAAMIADRLGAFDELPAANISAEMSGPAATAPGA